MAAPPDALRLQRLVESSPMGMHFYRLEAGRLVFSGANPVCGCPARPPGPPERPGPPEPPEPARARRARILVVDDERLVRDTLARVLGRDGHEVLLAAGGVEGVTLYSGAWRDIDLVVLDMMMPDLGGADVHAALAAINPAVRVVLASGYVIEGAMTQAVAGGRAWVLQKPFALDDLRRIVAEALAVR